MVKFLRFTKSVMAQSATDNMSGLASHYINLSKISDARLSTASAAVFRVNRAFLTTKDAITVSVSPASSPNIISFVEAVTAASTNGYSNTNNVYTYDTLPSAASPISTIALG
jgi:hypothetical protein